MVFVEFVSHVISLDLSWLFAYATGNALWLFLFAAMAYYLWDGKKWIMATMAVFTLLTLEQDFMGFTGWIYLTGAFLTLEFVTQTVSTIITEDTPKLKGKIPLITTLRFLILVGIYNIIILG